MVYQWAGRQLIERGESGEMAWRDIYMMVASVVAMELDPVIHFLHPPRFSAETSHHLIVSIPQTKIQSFTG